MQSRIQRSSLHLKHISGSQTQSLDNAISMLRSPLQRLKNKHVECSLQQLDSVLILVFLVHRCRHSTPMEVDCLLGLCRALKFETSHDGGCGGKSAAKLKPASSHLCGLTEGGSSRDRE